MKSLRIKLIPYCLLLSNTGFCQNLIANWSFEDTIPCISNPFIGMPETALPWESYLQSPDFWSLAYCGGSNIGPFFGFQIPKSGASFVGIGVYDSQANVWISDPLLTASTWIRDPHIYWCGITARLRRA